MKPSELSAALQAVIPTGQTVYVWGAPGVGKSSIVNQVAQNMNYEFIDLRAVLLDPVDLRGLPMVKDGRATWAVPDFLPHNPGPGILFIDELSQAAPMVQAALLQLVLDRRCGDYVLPDGWVIIAASNRAEDRAGGHRIISPLQNRFMHIDLDVDNDDWHNWAAGPGAIATVVRSFLKFRPNLLFSFDPSTNPRAYPTPRSWSFVSRILPATNDSTLHAMAAGCVGDGPAAEFAAFARIFHSLPSVDDALANPERAAVPSSPDVLYAMAGAVADKAKGADAKRLGAIVKYAARMPKEFSVLLIRDAMAVNPAIATTAEGRKWIADNRNLLLGD